ncbi:hypothetical protein [Streptomyces sp. KR80]|uniref:hypothetical protein n=1 Tax=Streptomyces sp. KR80 TaxID=3457426 RepID=UPI003FD2D6C2
MSSSPKTAMAPPVHLTPPAEQPDPVPGCDVCAALDRQRREAAVQGDHSQATDCNVEIRRHPHGGRK